MMASKPQGSPSYFNKEISSAESLRWQIKLGDAESVVAAEAARLNVTPQMYVASVVRLFLGMPAPLIPRPGEKYTAGEPLRRALTRVFAPTGHCRVCHHLTTAPTPEQHGDGCIVPLLYPEHQAKPLDPKLYSGLFRCCWLNCVKTVVLPGYLCEEHRKQDSLRCKKHGVYLKQDGIKPPHCGSCWGPRLKRQKQRKKRKVIDRGL